MEKDQETRQERLARLEEELQELKSTLPEHCYGTEGYISVHRATPAQWQSIEETEEEIARLKKELGL
jgi:HPt (histidine-containing phosphotransfer) domain-containing protein